MSAVAAFALLVIAGAVVDASADFACQSTINTYNQYVNIGQFEMAANLTFTDDVRYVIPGPANVSLCPYCNTYDGKAAVVSLFVDGFLGHFTIVNPLVNLRQIDTGANRSGVPRLMNFNQESFVTKPEKTKGGVGRYFSVPVIHDFTFDGASCKINQMILYQDPFTVTRVFAGFSASASPVMPFVVFSSPPTTFFSVQNASDFQIFPQEEDIPAEQAKALALGYYAAVKAGNGTLDIKAVKSLFMELDYTVPQAVATYIVPGDASFVPFSGMFMDVDQIAQAHKIRHDAVNESLPIDSADELVWVTDHGSVALHYNLRGVSRHTGRSYDCAAVDYFQVFQTSQGLRIGRLTRFYDTYNVTMAVHDEKKH
jgi:hypothetical protein